MPTSYVSKDASIQVRLPAIIKTKARKNAKVLGLSLSDYLRFLIISDTKEAKITAQSIQFWLDVQKSEEEYKAGLATETSAQDLIHIAQQTRSK